MTKREAETLARRIKRSNKWMSAVADKNAGGDWYVEAIYSAPRHVVEVWSVEQFEHIETHGLFGDETAPRHPQTWVR